MNTPMIDFKNKYLSKEKSEVKNVTVPENTQDTGNDDTGINLRSFENEEFASNLGSNWLKTLELPLSEIEEFEDNVRLHIKEADLQPLIESIKTRDDIWNIDVYHIKEWDRYIIADGHRRLAAYKIAFENEPTKKVTVVIRKEVDSFIKEVKMSLMEIGFITSNTKDKLPVFDQLVSYRKYLKDFNDTFDHPEWKKFTIGSKKVYESLWLTKSSAMRYNQILKCLTPEQINKLGNIKWMSLNAFIDLTAAKEEERDSIIELIVSEEIKDAKWIKELIKPNPKTNKSEGESGVYSEWVIDSPVNPNDLSKDLDVWLNEKEEDLALDPKNNKYQETSTQRAARFCREATNFVKSSRDNLKAIGYKDLSEEELLKMDEVSELLSEIISIHKEGKNE